MDPATSELVRRCRAGDERAFEELAQLLVPRVYRLACRSLGDRTLAEDVAQEALIRIYRRLPGLTEADAFDGWLYRITLNLIHDQFRRLGRERAALVGMGELRQLTSQPVEGLSKTEREELRATLAEAIAALDEGHREVFVLKEIEGLPHAEIARVLELPEGTVWSRLAYARKMLRERLRRRGVPGGR